MVGDLRCRYASAWVAITATLFVACCLEAATTTVYVVAGAAPGGTGTQSSPYSDLNVAVYEAAKTTGSDPIIVKVSGTFNQSLKIVGPNTAQVPPVPYQNISQRVKNITIEKAAQASTATIRGNGSTDAVFVSGSFGVTFRNITISGGNRFDCGIYVEGTHHLAFKYCEVRNARVRGCYVTGGNSDYVDFESCKFINNLGDGLYIRGSDSNRLFSVDVEHCICCNNVRQGMKTEFVTDFYVVGGSYNDNDASGIQIEKGSKDVDIYYVTANYNNKPDTGEAGIWIDEAEDITLLGCIVSQNHFGIAVSQSRDVTIEGGSITNAKKPIGAPWGGLRISTGAHHYAGTATAYGGQPFGGVRGLRVKDVQFSNNGNASGNNKGDIFYGDTEGTTPYNRMTFIDNKVHTNCTVDNGVLINPNDLDDVQYVLFVPEDANHEPLSFTSF